MNMQNEYMSMQKRYIMNMQMTMQKRVHHEYANNVGESGSSSFEFVLRKIDTSNDIAAIYLKGDKFCRREFSSQVLESF